MRDETACDSVTGMSLRSRQNEYSETLAERAEDMERRFRASLDRWGESTSGDDRVPEEVAARLIGYSFGTFRNMRNEGRTPRAYRLGRSISYRVPELAVWLAERMEIA